MAIKVICIVILVINITESLPFDNITTSKDEARYEQELRDFVKELIKSREVLNEIRTKRESDKSGTLPGDCPKSETVVQGRDIVCQDSLIFQEDFDLPTLDLKKWKAEVKFPEEPDYPFNVYLAEAIKLKNGLLAIAPETLESHFHAGILYEELDLTKNCTGPLDSTQCKKIAAGALIMPPAVTGKITTKDSFNFKYGRVEIRAKLPAGEWLVPELNLEPTKKVYGSRHYESGLMRVAFSTSIAPRTLYGGPLLTDSDPYRSHWMMKKSMENNWHEAFHIYTMVWRPDSIELFVDGEKYGTVKPDGHFSVSAKEYDVAHAGLWKTPMAPLDELFYISLGLRVGGVHDFPDSAEKPWGNTSIKAMLHFWQQRDTWLSSWSDSNLMVDYVKVYAL